MLITKCGKCKLEFPVEQVMHNLTEVVGGTLVATKVCQRCYQAVLNENTNKANLLVEG